MSPSIQSRVQGLDVLRGIAVGLVLLRHAWPDVFGGAGIVGVVIFFTLSGYLITGVLMRDIDRYGRVRFGRFYRNRALRLLPALVAVTAAIAIVALTLNLLDDRGEVLRTVLVALTYTADIPFDHGSEAIGHLWTLAIEEQFYLVWPFVLLIGVKFRRLRAAVGAVAVVMVLASIGMMFVAAPLWGRLYMLPTSWAIAMVIGAGLQLALHRYGMVWPVRGRRPLIVVAAVVLACVSLYPDLKNTAWVYALGAIVIGLATAVLINSLRDVPTVRATVVLPLLMLGTISYAAYLWNYPLTLWFEAVLPAPWAAPLALVATIVVATLSWWLVERPFLTWKDRLDARAFARADQAQALSEIR